MTCDELSSEGMSKMAEKFEPVGRCIYCGSTDKLTDEHIIPYSLHGNDVLPKASCETCARKTGKLEGYIGRVLFAQVRADRNFRTRRPKERPTHFPMNLQIDNGYAKIDLPVQEYPNQLKLPFLALPGFLDGRSRAARRPDFKVAIWYPSVTEAAHEKLRALGATAVFPEPIRLDVAKLERFIAKVTHARAVARFGVDSFEHFLPPIILGDTNRSPYYIGAFPGAYPSEGFGMEWGSQPYFRKRQRYLVARIRFFGDNGVRNAKGIGTPIYLAVVGCFKGHVVPYPDDTIDSLRQKFGLPAGTPVPEGHFSANT